MMNILIFINSFINIANSFIDVNKCYSDIAK